MLRHAIVRWIWRVIDGFSDRECAREKLPLGVESSADLAYGPDPAQRLDIYRPQGEGPVVVYVHGGGFVAGDKRHTKRYCMEVAREGYVVVNLNYRLAPAARLEEQVADVLGACQWTKENIGAYGGDTTRMILAGNSAGAYLAAYAACLLTNPALAAGFSDVPLRLEGLKGLALFSGLFDLATGARRSFPGIQSDIELALGIQHINQQPNLEKYSVTANMTSDYPAAFVSCGEVDGLYPESVELIKVLEAQGVPFTKVLFPRGEKTARHDFQNRPGPASEQSFIELLKFLAQVTR